MNNQNPQQTKSIWFDEEKNKIYLINNATGEKEQCLHTGEFIKKFDASLTGAVTYKERIEKANNRREFMPIKATSLLFNPKINYYYPENDKFVGYTQYPNSRINPYENQKRQLQLNRKKKKLVDIQKKYFSPNNLKNQTLYNYGDINAINLKHLTGQKKDLDQSLKKNQITMLNERSNSQQIDLTNINDKEKLQNTVKIINNKYLQKPNLYLFDKYQSQLKERQKEERQKINQLLQDQKEKSQKLDVRINQTRYNLKVKSLTNKTKYFNSTPNNEQILINTFYQTEFKKEQNIPNLMTTLQTFKTKTFDSQNLLLNFGKSDKTDLKLKTESMLNAKLQREKDEFLGFKVPEQKELQKVFTKGRFNSSITTPYEQFKKDQEIMKEMYPELFKVKEIKKKRLFIDPITKKTIIKQSGQF